MTFEKTDKGEDIFEFDSHRRIIKNSIVTNQIVWLINNEGKTVDRLSD